MTFINENSDPLVTLGMNIREARTIRKMSIREASKIASVSPNTLLRIEAGDPNTCIGKYLAVLKIFGFEQHLIHVASPLADFEGRQIRQGPKSQAPKYKPRGKSKSNNFADTI